jgi:hypothetical protein
MRRTFSNQYCWLAMILFLLLCSSAWTAENPTAADFAAASRRSRERLSKEPVTWTVDHGLAGGAVISVRVVRNGAQATWTVASPEFAQPVVRVIERDGLWYVSDGALRYKCRPYEAPFELPTISFLLARSELLLWEDANANLGKLVTTDGKVATFKLPLTGPVANELQQAAKKVKEALVEVPPQNRAMLQDQLTTIERRLKEGDDLKLSVADGVVLEQSGTSPTIKIREFRWNPPINANEFVPAAGANWEDRTIPWKTPPEDWAVIGYVGAWRPGSPKWDSDAVLSDLKTGNLRRIPYRYGIASTSCFSNDRSKVFVSGTTPFAGMALSEIDLKSGANRRIVSSYDLGSGPILFPSLSPDGSTIALLGTNGGGVLDAQVWLIDVATGRAQKLGAPFDTSRVSWLPDGSGLIAVWRRRSKDRELSSICKLGLDGKLTQLCDGSSPIVLGNTPKILFDARAGDSSRWMICDLDGQNARILGDGLAKFGFPSPSKDGDQVLMMHFGEAEGPKPAIVNVATGEAKELPVGSGLWVLPAWR